MGTKITREREIHIVGLELRLLMATNNMFNVQILIAKKEIL
jgi:hypothetical protein